jgi:hypothetical protein
MLRGKILKLVQDDREGWLGDHGHDEPHQEEGHEADDAGGSQGITSVSTGLTHELVIHPHSDAYT